MVGPAAGYMDMEREQNQLNEIKLTEKLSERLENNIKPGIIYSIDAIKDLLELKDDPDNAHVETAALIKFLQQNPDAASPGFEWVNWTKGKPGPIEFVLRPRPGETKHSSKKDAAKAPEVLVPIESFSPHRLKLRAKELDIGATYAKDFVVGLFQGKLPKPDDKGLLTLQKPYSKWKEIEEGQEAGNFVLITAGASGEDAEDEDFTKEDQKFLSDLLNEVGAEPFAGTQKPVKALVELYYGPVLTGTIFDQLVHMGYIASDKGKLKFTPKGVTTALGK